MVLKTHLARLIATPLAGLLGFAALATAEPAMAAGHGHRHVHAAHAHFGHAHPHGGHRLHIEGRHHGGGPRHGFGGWHRGGWDRGRVIIRQGRTVVIDRPYPLYGRPHVIPVFAGYGGRCSTSRHVSLTPSGWHKVVTTKVCYVP